MREVFVDVFRSIATQYRRLRTGGPDPDWEATVSAAHACSLQPVGVRDAARSTACVANTAAHPAARLTTARQDRAASNITHSVIGSRSLSPLRLTRWN